MGHDAPCLPFLEDRDVLWGEWGGALLPTIFAKDYITRETFASIAYPGSNPPGSQTVPPFLPIAAQSPSPW